MGSGAQDGDRGDGVLVGGDASLPGGAGQPCGVMNIDKPAGLTSHDVVSRVRRLAGTHRVGHAGTLDPMATGVLVVCIGRATRIVEYLSDTRKTYRATIRLGTITDTWDATGRVVEEAEWRHLTLASLQGALQAFRGRIEQVPPMYSALKRNGEPLYRLARKGIEVPRAARAVDIHALRIVSFVLPDVAVEVECSKGTYIRSLAYDLGRALGSGAHLAAITRLAVGRMTLADAVPLATLEAEKGSGRWRQHLLSLRQALAHLPAIAVDDEEARRLGHGQALALAAEAIDTDGEPKIACALDAGGHIVAIVQSEADSGLWRPVKVLAPEPVSAATVERSTL